MLRKIITYSLLALTIGLTACAPTQPTAMMQDAASPTAVMMKDTATPDAMMHDTATPEAMMHDTVTPDAMMHDTTTPDAMMQSPQWVSATLSDVTSGKTFKINDFKGKVVLVETMAQWCPTCKSQQTEAKALLSKLGMPANLVLVSLDIDPNENAATLKTYAANNTFDWTFAVAPADVSREIGKLYGDQFLNPPSAPMLIVDAKGEAHPLPFGLKNSDDLMKALEPYLKAAM
jgi:thiol-disulfide isomerase/thioredoxin